MESGQKKQSTHGGTEYITLLAVISCVSVVFLHVNGCFWNYSRERYWFSANIIECIFYFAVPVFFMISGATLMDYRDRYSNRIYAKKRIHRTLVPYVAWCTVWLFASLLIGERKTGESFSIRYFLNGLFTGSVGGYWFFIPLFCIYLLIPIFSLIPKSQRKSSFSFYVIIYFVIESLLPFLNDVFSLDLSIDQGMLNIGSGYMFYVLLGYLLSSYELKPKQRKLIYIFGAGGGAAHIVGTWILSNNAGEIVETYKGYLNVPCILYSIAIFVFFRQHGNNLMRNKLLRKVVSLLSKYTLSIYLVHEMILAVINRIAQVASTALSFRLFVPFVVIVIAILLVYLVRKIPIIREIVP